MSCTLHILTLLRFNCLPCIDNTVYVIMYIASCTYFIYGSISVNNPYTGLYQTFPLYWRKSKLDTFLQSLHLFETLVIGRWVTNKICAAYSVMELLSVCSCHCLQENRCLNVILPWTMVFIFLVAICLPEELSICSKNMAESKETK